MWYYGLTRVFVLEENIICSHPRQKRIQFYYVVPMSLNKLCLTTCTYSPPHIMLTVTVILRGVEVFSFHCHGRDCRCGRPVLYNLIWLLTCKDNKFMVVLGIGTHPAAIGIILLTIYWPNALCCIYSRFPLLWQDIGTVCYLRSSVNKIIPNRFRLACLNVQDVWMYIHEG